MRAAVVRSRMHKQRVHTVMPCIHRLIESGNKDGAISLCQKVIMVDPDLQPLFERFIGPQGTDAANGFLQFS